MIATSGSIRIPGEGHALAHRKIQRHFKTTAKMANDELPLNWGTAELAAFASLLAEGTPVRITGQVGRGPDAFDQGGVVVALAFSRIVGDVENGRARYIPVVEGNLPNNMLTREGLQIGA